MTLNIYNYKYGPKILIPPSSTAVADDKPQCVASVSLLKLAPKFRVFSLGYRKFKPAAAEPNAASPKQQPQEQQGKFFARDRRARSSSTNRPSKTTPDANTTATVQSAAAADVNNTATVLQKYRNMIKPLYVRASKKHIEKHKLSGASSEAEPPEEEAPAKYAGGGKSLPAGMRAAGKRLGKSWQTSSAVAAVPSPPPLPPPPQRRDDSLLELQDGIQNAIAHCKRSFTAPDKGSAESPLARSKSEPIPATVDCPA